MLPRIRRPPVTDREQDIVLRLDGLARSYGDIVAVDDLRRARPPPSA